MVAYRFKARSELAPGDWTLKPEAFALLAAYPAVADVRETVVYGSEGEYEGTAPLGGTIPPYTGLGPVTLAEECFAHLLADSPAFRAWVGATTQAQALAHVHNDSLPPPDSPDGAFSLAQLRRLRPYAILGTEDSDGYGRDRVASSTYADHGALWVMLIQEVPGDLAADVKAAERAWKNTIGAILVELCQLALNDSATHRAMDIAKIAVVAGPYRNAPEEIPAQGEIQGVELSISWGAA
jgi:hypothetical protein